MTSAYNDVLVSAEGGDHHLPPSHDRQRAVAPVANPPVRASSCGSAELPAGAEVPSGVAQQAAEQPCAAATAGGALARWAAGLAGSLIVADAKLRQAGLSPVLTDLEDSGLKIAGGHVSRGTRRRDQPYHSRARVDRGADRNLPRTRQSGESARTRQLD